MNLPAGVTIEQWAAALRVIGHPWREGQRCEGPSWNTNPRSGSGMARCEHGFIESHDIPMPAVTDELLMRCLKSIESRGYTWRIDFAPWFRKNEPYEMQLWAKDKWLGDSEITVYGESLAAAVIRAWAGMGEK